jgi:hypothetical protein
MNNCRRALTSQQPMCWEEHVHPNARRGADGVETFVLAAVRRGAVQPAEEHAEVQMVLPWDGIRRACVGS